MEEAAPEVGGGDRIQHVGEAILIIVGAYLAASFAVTIFDPLVTAAVGDAASTNAVRIVQTVLQFVTMIAVVVGYGRLVDTERLIRAVVPSRRSVGLIVGGTVVLLGGQYLINRLLDAAGFSPGANQAVLAGVGDPFYYLVMIVVSLGAQLSYALLAGVLGIVLGYLYEYTDNIVVPAVTHGCYNGTLFALLYLGEIGYLG